MNSPLPTAKTQRSRWPGLIWAVPLAALAIVAWLGLKTYMSQGPSVTVEFPTMGGIKPDHTVVKYRGVIVGHVTAVKLSQSLGEISVTMRFDNYMAHHLGKGTRYWIAGEKVSFSNLSSLKSLIAGPYIGIDPQPGRIVHHVLGLPEEPVLKSESKGITLILHAPEKGNISRGAPILFRGKQVGEVRGEALQKNGKGFDIYAFLPEQYLHLVNSHSRFWSSGNIAISLFGTRPGVHVPAIPALLSGAISFSTPQNGSPVTENEDFPLYANAAAAENAPRENAVAYQMQMPGGPQGLKVGAAVMLEGARVGSVSSVHMFFDADRQALFTHIQILINPEAIPLSHGQHWDMAHPAAQMNGILRHLIAQGLRAQLGTTVPLLGSQVIDLVMVPRAKAAHLIPGQPPEIPMVQSAEIQDTIRQLNGILDKIHALPLRQIAGNLNRLTHNLSALSSSPETRETLQHVQQSLAHLDQLSKTADTDLPAILKSLKSASKEADAALQAGNALLRNQGAAANGPESTTLPRALYELSRTAQSLRELTDYLNSHPNALIFGKRP